MRIIFFGTTDFAAKKLNYLCKNNHKIISVITLPDRRQGRGKKEKSTPVKEMASELEINTLTPDQLDDLKFVKKLESLSPDLAIVVAFKKIPKKVWQIPKMGTINLHASLLPSYRGAAPINRVLINGEEDTGITTFFINDRIDTGDIILQKRIKLSKNTTGGELYNIMKEEGANLLLDTIKNILSNNISKIKQDNNNASPAKKINKELTRINWKESVINIHNLIRGLSPVIGKNKELKNISIFPGAWFILVVSKEKEIRSKILYSRFSKETNNKPLSIETDNKSFFKINLESGSIYIERIQLSGKNPMDISTFLMGYKVDKNWKIK